MKFSKKSISSIVASSMLLCLPATAGAEQTIALAKTSTNHIVPTAGFGTAVRERMRDRAITRTLPALALSNGQRAEIRVIQQNFRAKRPGTRGATEPELASYHAQLLNVLTPGQREQLRVKMKQHWINEHSP